MKKAVLQFAICNFFYALWIVCVFGVLVLISAPASESETWKERTEPPVKWSGSPKEGGRTIEKLLHRHLTDGTTYLEEGKWDEAIAEFQQALKISSNHLHAHMNLGIAYQEKQMWDEAIVEYEKVILLDPNLAFAYNNLGLVYWRKGQHQTAIFSLKKAISLDPERANGYANLGMVYISQSMLKEAITEFETALEISPDLETIRKNLAIAHLNLGINHYNEGIFTEARSELNKALELDPEFSEVKDLIEDIEKIERERKLAAEEGTGRQPGKGLGVSYQVAGDLKPWEATVQWRKNVFTERPFVEVTLNGTKKEEFLINSRSFGILIAQDVANGLSINPGNDEKKEKAVGKIDMREGRRQGWIRGVAKPGLLRKEYPVSFVSLAVGGLNLKNVSARALMILEERGVLGLPVIGQFGWVRLDLDRGKLSFKPYDGTLKAKNPWGGQGPVSGAVSSSNPLNPFVIDISINGKPCKALIDPGSSSTVISPALLGELQLRTKVSRNSRGIRSVGDGSIPKTPLWRIVKGEVKVQIGEEEIVGNRHGDIQSYDFQPFDVDVILGMPHLRGFIITLDYRSSRLSLARIR